MNAKNGEVCPASWTPGARSMAPGQKDKLDAYWKEVHAKNWLKTHLFVFNWIIEIF